MARMKASLLTGILSLALAAGLHAQSLEKQREIAGKKRITLGDAVLLFHALHAEPDKELTVEKAFANLVEAEILPEDWEEELEEEATLGQVSYLILKILKIEGGLTARLFGLTRRSAYRECARAQIVRRAGPHGSVSGRALIGVVGRVEDLLETSK
jgi:hypothetical protein